MDRIWYDPLKDSLPVKKRIVTFGNFDGIHVGHRALMSKVSELAQNTEEEKPVRCMVCFAPHFREMMGDTSFRRIYSDEKREDLAEESGLIDEIITIRLTPDFAALTPEDFFRRVVVEQLHAAAVVVGDDFRYGRYGKGTPEKMIEMCAEEKIHCEIIPGVDIDGARVSSSRVRKLLEEGEIEAANRLLGRPYYVETIVKEGKHVGRQIDTPTVNLPMDDRMVVPRKGVYATTIEVEGKTYQGISNVGNNPTFGGESLRCEMFIFDFHEDLYGKKVKVELFLFIRPEQVFEGPQALKTQLVTDIRKTKEYFENGYREICG